jgi:hypothetical protein
MSVKVFKGVEGEGKTVAERTASYFRNLRERSDEFYQKVNYAQQKRRESDSSRAMLLALAMQISSQQNEKNEEKKTLMIDFGMFLQDIKDTFNELFNDLFDDLDNRSELEKQKQIKKDVEELKRKTDVDYKTVIEKLGISEESNGLKNIALFDKTASLALQDGVINKSEMANLLKIYLTLSNEEVLALKTSKSELAVVMIEELDSNPKIKVKRLQHLKLEEDNKLENKKPKRSLKPH